MGGGAPRRDATRRDAPLRSEKEGRAKDTIAQLKHEIQNLSRLVEQGAGLSIGQENTVNELLKVKGELSKERETQAQMISALMSEIAG